MIGREDVQGLFGDLLAEIRNETLREQVVTCWVEGCREGGWETVEELSLMPFTLLTDTYGANFVRHTRAVTAGALALARAMMNELGDAPFSVNWDWLVAGGLLHDVGKLMEIEQDGLGGFHKSHAGRCARHPISGAILAGKHGVPEEVVNIIACHSREGDGRPQRVETVFVHQADFATFNPLVMINKGTLITEGGS